MSDETTENQLLAGYLELRTLCDSLELDLTKQASGNAAAGGRSRKGLRLVGKKVRELVKLSLEMSKK